MPPIGDPPQTKTHRNLPTAATRTAIEVRTDRRTRTDEAIALREANAGIGESAATGEIEAAAMTEEIEATVATAATVETAATATTVAIEVTGAIVATVLKARKADSGTTRGTGEGATADEEEITGAEEIAVAETTDGEIARSSGARFTRVVRSTWCRTTPIVPSSTE